MTELEAKYLLAPGAQAERTLSSLTALLEEAGYNVGEGVQVELCDEYGDTADWALYRARWSYRLRHKQGDQRLTLKRLGNGQTGLFHRTEIEQPVANGQGPVAAERHGSAWAAPRQGPVAQELAALLPAEAPLQRLFAVTNRRTTHSLTHPQFPDAVVAMAVDRVRSDGGLDYTELEFELTQGDRGLLVALTELLDDHPDLYRSRLSKFQRALVNCPQQPPSPQQRLLPVSDPRCRWRDLALEHLNRQFAELKRWEPLAWESLQVEGVHQTRVATRRIRAALRAFDDVLPPAEAARLTEDVRWLGRKLGAVRDLDVHLQHLDEYAEELDAGELQSLDAYRTHLQQSRREAHQALIAALASVRLTTLLEDYADLLLRTSNYGGDLAGLRIDQAAARIAAPTLEALLRRGRKIDDNAKARKLHKLRIRVKRVRYLLEYLSTPYAPALDKVGKRLAKLQDVLGDHQDAYVARDHLAEYVDARRLGKAERRTFKHLRKIEKRRAKAARSRFDKAWRKLEDAAAPALHVLR